MAEDVKEYFSRLRGFLLKELKFYSLSCALSKMGFESED